KSGQRFAFRHALPVDAGATLADGRAFRDIREFKRLLVADPRAIARGFASQLVVYATCAPVGFADLRGLGWLLDRAASTHYGVRTLIHEVVRSELFMNK